MATSSQHPDVLVIGAGVVGAAVAHELAARGAGVTVVDEGPDVGHGCSYANAGLLAPAHVEPLTTPQNLAAGLRYLLRRDSPFHLSPSPRLAPWLVRFAAASTPARARRLTALLRELAWESLAQHRAYAAAGWRTGLSDSGSLDVYLTLERFATATAGAAGSDGGHGVRVLTAEQARELVPGLGRVAGAVLHEQDATCDTQAFARAALAAATGAGATVRWGTHVRRLEPHGGGLRAELDAGPGGAGTVTPGAVVVAAGLGSTRLLRPLGVRLPMTGGKGYVIDVPPQAGPPMALTFKELKVVATPYPDRLRFCGTMDLGETGDGLVQRRVDAVRRAAAAGLPGVDTGRPVQVWAGQRPCLADGVPAIGPVRSVPGLHLATGHGMWGLVLAPVTAALVAATITQGLRDDRFAPLAPDRFARG